jgi:flagellin-like protein
MLKQLSTTVDDERGAAPVVGNLLLVGIVLILGAAVVLLSLPFVDGLQSKSPNVATDATVTDGEIRFVHKSGANLDSSNLEVVVETENETKRVPFSQGTVTGSEGSFTAGNRWRYCQVAEPGSSVETMLVHTESNSVLARVEQSAQETRKTGIEYRCGSAVRQTGRNGGWATFNMTNYADETFEIVGLNVTSDSDATRLEGLNSSGVDHTDVYIDASGGPFTFSPNSPGSDGIAYSTPSAGPFDVGPSPEHIDLTAGPNFAFSTAVIESGNTTRFSLYQFQNSTGSPADMRGAELLITLSFANHTNQTYSLIMPQERVDS